MKEKSFETNAQNSPDFKYEREKDPDRLEEISQGIENPKKISVGKKFCLFLI